MNLLITIISYLLVAVVAFYIGRKKGMSAALTESKQPCNDISYDENANDETVVVEELAAKNDATEISVAEEASPDEIAVKDTVAEEVVAEETIAEETTPTDESSEEKVNTEESAAEECTAEEHTMEDDGEKSVTNNKDLVASLHKLLEEDKVFLQPDIRIDDVARMIYTNRTYITRLMRQEYGLTFIEYVNIMRIQHSQHLLYSYNMTLDEVAYKSGFQSTSNYCRAFKRYIGTSPLTWLQNVKGSKQITVNN